MRDGWVTRGAVGQAGAVYALAVLGDVLFSGHGGGALVQWDLVQRAATRRVCAVRAGSAQWIRCAGAGGGALVTGSAYGVGRCEVRVWALDAHGALAPAPSGGGAAATCREALPQVPLPPPCTRGGLCSGV